MGALKNARCTIGITEAYFPYSVEDYPKLVPTISFSLRPSRQLPRLSSLLSTPRVLCSPFEKRKPPKNTLPVYSISSDQLNLFIKCDLFGKEA